MARLSAAIYSSPDRRTVVMPARRTWRLTSATVTSSERVTEFAILRALGLSARELSAWVSLENAFLLVFGLLADTVLGIILA